MLNPGVYYIGDPGCALYNDDLRMVFSRVLDKSLVSNYEFVVASGRYQEIESENFFYWITPMPNRKGTLYGDSNSSFGFDWHCFGVIPWEWVEFNESFIEHKFEFTEPFECSFDDEIVKVGHLQFTFKPK